MVWNIASVANKNTISYVESEDNNTKLHFLFCILLQSLVLSFPCHKTNKSNCKT